MYICICLSLLIIYIIAQWNTPQTSSDTRIEWPFISLLSVMLLCLPSVVSASVNDGGNYLAVGDMCQVILLPFSTAGNNKKACRGSKTRRLHYSHGEQVENLQVQCLGHSGYICDAGF